MNKKFDIDFNKTTSSIQVCDGDTVTFTFDKSDIKKIVVNYNAINYCTNVNSFDIQFKFPNDNNEYSITTQANIHVIYIENNNLINKLFTINVTIYRASLLSSFDSLHLLKTQFIDNADNHIFCIYESGNNHILISTIKQYANRVLMYELQKEENIIKVFSDYYDNMLYCITTPSNFNLSDGVAVSDDTIIYMVPLSTEIQTVATKYTDTDKVEIDNFISTQLKIQTDNCKILIDQLMI